MNVQSFRDITSSISKKIDVMKYNNKQKELNKYVDISHVLHNPNDRVQVESYKELYEKRALLANYAKANDVTIRIGTLGGESYKNQVFVTVTDKADKNKFLISTANADPKVIETVQRERHLMLENKDGENYGAIGIETHEDDLITRISRKVASLTKCIKEGHK
jgi:hypothetical protein